MKRSFKTALAVAGATIALLAPMSPAHAGHGVSDSLSTTGARGTFSGTWNSRTRIDPLNFRVFDTACDGRGVYVYFRVYTPGTDWNTPRRENYNGCNTDQSWSSYINDGNGISGIRFYVCRDDGTCNNKFYANPHF